MKGQKTKLMKKLEGLKKREQTTIPLNDDPMEQEIPFASDEKDDRTEVSDGQNSANKSNEKTPLNFDIASVANAPVPCSQIELMAAVLARLLASFTV